MHLNCLAILLLFLYPCWINAQVDVKSSQVTLVGMGLKNTSHQGILAQSAFAFQEGQYILEAPAFPKYHALGKSLDCRHLEFWRNYCFSASWESIVYYAGRILSDSKDPYSGGFAFVAGQSVKELDKPELQDLTDQQKRWINLRYLEANGVYGKSAFQYGLHLSLREMGHASLITFESKGREYQIANTSELAGKLLLGPAVGFRKTIDDLAIVAFGSVSGSVNTHDSFKLKYSPHAEVSAFYGKKVGVFGSAYYRMFIGKEIDFAGANIAPVFNEFSLHFGLYFLTGE